MTSLADLGVHRVVLLTTSAVDTPVNAAVADGHAYVRTWATSAKAKRIAGNPSVTVAPSTYRGNATGPATPAVARTLTGEEAAAAGALIDRTFPILQRLLVPVGHRLKRVKPIIFELTLDQQVAPPPASHPPADGRLP